MSVRPLEAEEADLGWNVVMVTGAGEACAGGIGAQLRQAGLHRVDVISSFAGCLCHRQGLVAMGVEISAGLPYRFLCCVGGVAAPRAEGRQLCDAVGCLERCFGPAAGGIENRLFMIDGVVGV